MDSIKLIFKSLSVSKKWHDGYVYYLYHNKQRRRKYFIPYNPKTQAQMNIRNNFKNLCLQWKSLTEVEKNVYRLKVKKQNLKMTGFNLFIKENWGI